MPTFKLSQGDIDILITTSHKCFTKKEATIGLCYPESNEISLTNLTSEKNIIKVIEHEFIHILLWKTINKKSCKTFDNIKNMHKKDWY